MTQIVFYTPTILPKACLFTMGVSAKETEHPIGFFGTGLKYAIAVCMRLGAKIEIDTYEPERHGTWRNQISFVAEPEQVRNKTFDIIYAETKWADGDSKERMPMTLDYGKTWEPWMALRELYSNTIDENGEMWSSITDGDDPMGWPHHPRSKSGTYITVTCDAGSELETAWIDRHGTWLLNPRRTPVWENDNLQVFLQPSSALYYRGIRVSQKGFQSGLTYNLRRNHTLTEDRTLDMWDFHYDYETDILKIDKTDVIRKILQSSGNTDLNENKFRLGSIHDFGNTQWKEELLRMYKLNPESVSDTARASAQEYILKTDFSSLYAPAKVTPEMQERYDKCLETLYNAGFDLHKYKIRLSKFDSKNMMGTADAKSRLIVIDVGILTLQDWHREFCTTLIEEYMHVEYNERDYSRGFQDLSLNLMYDMMMTGKIGKGAKKGLPDMPF